MTGRMRKRCARCERPVPIVDWYCKDCGGESVLTPGSQVSSRWRIVRLIRASSDSRVYLAHGLGDKSEVVLKSRPPGMHHAPEPQHVLDAFPITAVSHPNVVKALEGGVGADGAPWLALEPLDGSTIREHLSIERFLPAEEVAELLTGVAYGLAAIHEKGLVHGALDSRGVFLARGKTGRLTNLAVILDFAPVAQRDTSVADEPAVNGTLSGLGLGQDVSSDICALGSLAWECLSGRLVPPQAGAGERRLPVPLALLKPPVEVQPELDDFVMRMMAKDPNRRPASALEAARRFERWRPLARGRGVRGRADGIQPEDQASLSPAVVVELDKPAVAPRVTEMRRLAGALDAAAAGRGTVFWMEGDEGYGKTTLGKSFLDLALDRGFCVGTGRAVQGHRLTAWAESMTSAGMSAIDDTAMTKPLEDALFQFAALRPVALFLDDMQQADSFSVDLLERVAMALADRPTALVILATSRPLGRSRAGDEAGLHRALATIRGLGGEFQLTGMTDLEIDDVTAGMSRQPIDPGLRAVTRRSAAGNPMVAIEILRHLASQGTLTIIDGKVSLVAGRQAAIPDGLRQILAMRLDGLRRTPNGELAAMVLDRVVLLGRHATSANLKVLMDLEGRADLHDGLSRALQCLEMEGYIREVQWKLESFWMPVHAGLRDLLVAGICGPEAARLHLAVARVLESMAVDDVSLIASDLAVHYERAGYLDVAVEWLRLAADRAVSEGDSRRARDLLHRAEVHLVRLGLPEDPRRTAVLLDLVAWEVFGGRYQEAVRALAAAERDCAPATGSVLARRMLEVRACLDEARRHPHRAGADLERLVAEATAAGDIKTAGQARLGLACMQMDRGDNLGAEANIILAAAVLQGLDNSRTVGCLELVRGRLLRRTGPVVQALSCMDRALSVLIEPGDFVARFSALFFRAACLMDREEYEDALEASRTGSFVCDQAGYPRGTAAHLTHLAICLGNVGRVDEGMEAARRSLEIREKMKDSRGLAQVLAALAGLASRREDWSTARELSERALNICQQAGYVRGEREGLMQHARACHGMGDVPEARRRLEACLLTALRDDSLTISLADAHLLLADILDSSGESEAASRHRLCAVVVFDRLDRPDRSGAVRGEMGEALSHEDDGGAGGSAAEV